MELIHQKLHVSANTIKCFSGATGRLVRSSAGKVVSDLQMLANPMPEYTTASTADAVKHLLLFDSQKKSRNTTTAAEVNV